MMLLNKALLITSIAMLLNGCNQDDPTAPSTVAEPPKTEVELLNEQVWEDNRVYVSKDNYILTKEANGTIPGVMILLRRINDAFK
uniref:Uncharacterized protein n=1 Tax=Aliivibrio wodanis TaxID=80852 RepID=A0A5Q4ZVJ7_9GAMM|nr:hypothetical protein AW0309160_03432 [Aliivibrio wodanis]VVV05957.1 hypothetical protein AW0309160_03440 [Aliivibrio wodanis]